VAHEEEIVVNFLVSAPLVSDWADIEEE